MHARHRAAPGAPKTPMNPQDVDADARTITASSFCRPWSPSSSVEPVSARHVANGPGPTDPLAYLCSVEIQASASSCSPRAGSGHASGLSRYGPLPQGSRVRGGSPRRSRYSLPSPLPGAPPGSFGAGRRRPRLLAGSLRSSSPAIGRVQLRRGAEKCLAVARDSSGCCDGPSFAPRTVPACRFGRPRVAGTPIAIRARPPFIVPAL